MLGSARRPDPTPWVPAPEGEGAPAPTGEVAGVAPGGPHAAVRAAYVDFLRRVLASDWGGIVELFAPQVGMLSRPQTMDRNDVIRRLRQRVDRMQLQGARVEDVLEPREIRVRALEQDTRTSGITPGDLLVTASPRLPSQRSPFGGFEEDSPQISLVFHREEGRWVIVAGDL